MSALVVNGEALASSVYLRDDTELYRVVDTVAGSDASVWLENCRTLTLEKVPVKVLLKRRLRRVVPAPSEDRSRKKV